MAKVTVSIHHDLLHAVDAEASRRRMSRSAFLSIAARGELQRAAGVRLRDQFAAVGSFESADLVRAERDRDGHLADQTFWSDFAARAAEAATDRDDWDRSLRDGL